MNKAMMKFRLFLAVALLICVIPLQNVDAETAVDVSAPSWAASIDYLALGDSLAAGMDPNGGMGAGYPDHLAEAIEETGLLTSYNNNFSYSGYTTVNILQDLANNVTRDIAGSPVKLHDAIAEAEFITISIGANDVLPLIEFDPDTGTVVNPDMEAINDGIRQVGINVLSILVEINKVNPDAQVYVMGYYNPFPHMPKEIQPLLNNLVDGINTALGTVTDNPNVEYVGTKDVIAENPVAYLPNPSNIHLSEAGYQKVAEQFWNKMETAYPWVSADSMTADEVTKGTVKLNWQPAIDNVQVANYEVYQGSEKIATVEGDVLSYEVKGLTGNTVYSFSVVAVDEAGNKSIYHPETKIKTIIELPSTIAFTDIADHWAKEYIETAAATDLVRGYPDGKFLPDNELTRAQAATILVRALDLKTDKVSPFNDIGTYAKETQGAINAAYKYGLVKGQNGKFSPSENVTRAQLALMIERANAHKTDGKYIASGKAPFTDFGNYDAETVNAISMLHELGIANGSDGKFMPSNPTTRAHAAKMLVNFIGK